MTNFQDVLRDVHDPSLHALKTTASLSAATVYVGNPTLYAVVNTGAAGDSVANIGFATVSVSNPTLYAVVNTSAPGTTDITSGSGVTVYQGDTWTVAQASSARSITGNITLSPSVNSIGFATVHQGGTWTVAQSSAARTITGNLTLSDAKTYIGLVTTTPSNTVRSIVGNITLSPSINSIGFATVHLGTPTIYAVVNTGAAGVGNSIVTVANPNFGINAGVNFIGHATVRIAANPNTYIGLVTATLGNQPALTAGVANIGFATVAVSNTSRSILGNVTLSDSKTYIGLVTVTQGSTVRSIVGNLTILNAGTTKTLVSLPVAFALTSVSTVAVPTNTFKMTHLLLNSNATVGVSIKSGPTYLTGNASIRVTLSPTGGWVENGSPDSPIYIGVVGASAIVVEKDNATAAVAGKVVYFDE